MKSPLRSAKFYGISNSPPFSIVKSQRNDSDEREIARTSNMSNNKILRMLTVLLVLLMVSVLGWAGDKKKDNNPPPPPPRPAPQVRTAPASRPAPAPRQQQPVQQRQQTQPNPSQQRQQYPAQQRQQYPGQQRQPNPVQQRQQYPAQQRQQYPGQQRQPNPVQQRQQYPAQQRQQYPAQQRQQYPGQQSGLHPGTPRVLSPQESQQRLHDLNQNRGGMGGINRRPLPEGRLTSLPNGHHVIETNRGSRMQVRPNGTVERVALRDGRAATFHRNGQLGSVRAPGIRIDHGLRGERTIATERNGRRLVAVGPHRGYMERPYLNRNGRAYVQRTYWVGGHPYARAYRDHYYNGVHYYRYAPAYYYHPVFYGWAYNPWAAPVYYNWGWGPAPWFYGGYFAPAPYYPSATLWLTDFLLAENLKQAYEANREAETNRSAYGPDEQPKTPEGESPAATQLSPEVKQMIEAEVKRQLAEENATAQSPQPNPQAAPVGNQAPPAALDPTQSLFVVSSNLGVATADGQECQLTPGDVITRLDDTPGVDNKVQVRVMSSKQNDCSIGLKPMLAVDDLQEMHNSFREQLDSGLKTLAEKSGTGGLPKAPDTQTTAGEVPPPSPDRNVDAQLADQLKQADQAEREFQQEVQTGQAPPSQ